MNTSNEKKKQYQINKKILKSFKKKHFFLNFGANYIYFVR